ncbi:FkbM family methyltransferase [Nitrospira sp. BLG_1]|uniref:FkbM family methyltransferase n=1 Tax=Nitrospira sp. BLG_1 TaxID=3395883 RepID=UPI0039BCE9D6
MNLETAKRLSQKYALLGRMISPVQHFRASALQKSRAGKREVVRNLRNVLVTDPEVVIKEFEGKFSIDYRSDLFERIVIDGHYEPDLVRFCKKYLVGRRDVLDIGANIGFYTVMFAKNLHGRRVVAVEPTQNALKRLRTNITLNHVEDRVVVYEGVVTDKAEKVTMKVIPGKEEYSSIGVMEHPSIVQEEYVSEEVDSITVDDLVERFNIDPGFMKVDVEGGEHLVFSGAKKTLSISRPIILSELSDFLLTRNGGSSMEVVNLLRQYDYDVIDPLNPWAPVGYKSFGDVIGFPKEMNLLDELRRIA